ncbi:MAG: porin [Holosporales bacterium]|jgi:hypothetical protein|nr:porin [Holosporales bacterium]
MKRKILLSGMILIAACSNIAVSAEDVSSTEQQKSEEVKKEKSGGGKPELDISGAAAVHTAFTSPHNKYYAKKSSKSDKDTKSPRIAAGEANVDFNAKGTFDNGVRYGATISFDAMKGDTGVDKMYVFFEKDNIGTAQIGSVKGVESTMLCGGQQLLGGTCGVDGTVAHDMDYATGVISPLYLIGYTGKATKIAYYSPRIYGFQFGLSFTPDTKHVGHDDKNRRAGDSSQGNDDGIYWTDKKRPYAYIERPSGRNNIALGLNHKYEFNNGIGTKFAAVYLFENTKSVGAFDGQDNLIGKKLDIRNARGYQVTGTISYKKWAIGAGFLWNGKSRLPKGDRYITEILESDRDGKGVQHPNYGEYKTAFLATKNSNSGNAWNVGAQYKYDDNLTFAAVFHRSQRKIDKGQKTKANMLTVTADYKICDGLLVFFEFDHIQTKSCSKACEIFDKAFQKEKAFKEGKGRAIKKQNCQLFAIGAKVSF